ncbi:hypothetical protein [Actinomyces ruminis]|uniref:hypothetical protein n=1 Tax=Actinomyces ruminis TaxID=1937003 RepID=UPI00211E6A32|nr:hypothetical protein [Actinomyces ruminis]
MPAQTRSHTPAAGTTAPTGAPPRGDLPAPRPQRRYRVSFTALKTTMAITGPSWDCSYSST